MKDWKNLYILIIIISSSLGTFISIDSVKNYRNENNNKIINDYAIKLKRCFDLENKNQRMIHESLELIEYCIKEFGID